MVENILTAQFFKNKQEEINYLNDYFYSHLNKLPGNIFENLCSMGKHLISDSFESSKESKYSEESLSERLAKMFPKPPQVVVIDLRKFFDECTTLQDIETKLVPNLKQSEVMMDNVDGVRGLGSSLLATYVEMVDRILKTDKLFLECVRKAFPRFIEGDYVAFLKKLKESIYGLDRTDLKAVTLMEAYSTIKATLKELMPDVL